MISIDEVHAAEEMWAQAHLKTDAEVLERLMHPDFTIIKPDGTVGDKKWKEIRMVSDQSTEIP